MEMVECERHAPHLKEPGVSIKAASVQDAVLPLVELGQLLLQVFVEVLQTKNDVDDVSPIQKSTIVQLRINIRVGQSLGTCINAIVPECHR